MNSNIYDYIFVILTYKEHRDLLDFIKDSINKIDGKYKIIIVNNYYDEISRNIIKEIAKNNDFLYIDSPNDGYSKGNNVGVEFAIKNFEFKFLIVSNPDIEIISLNLESINENVITGPRILRKNKSSQNPFYFRYMRLSEYLIYIGKKYNKVFFCYLGIVLNKINKIINNFKMKLLKKTIKNVYSLHGSFMIFPYKILKKINVVFDEKMFLFNEEFELGRIMKLYNIKMQYNKKIVVFHKEDGSMDSTINQSLLSRESFLYYYSKRGNKQWIS